MADIRENVIIQFSGDTAGLSPAVDQLAAIGLVEKGIAEQFKKTNAEIGKQDALLKKTGTDAEKAFQGAEVNVADLAKALKGFTGDVAKAFQSGIVSQLDKMNVSLDEFLKTVKQVPPETKKIPPELEKAAKVTNQLKARLSEVITEMANLRAEGKQNTEQYQKLTAEAGKLRDEIQKVNTEIQGAASSTPILDGLIKGAEGAAAAFSIAQGAIGLFGDNADVLNEVLLDVNSSMAILQGLTSIQNVFTKESALLKLADALATGAQTAAQTLYNIVIGKSIGLLKVFRIALASTGIGLLLIALGALVYWLSQTNDELEKTNELLDLNRRLNEADADAIKKVTDEQITNAKSRNELESQLIRLRGRALQDERESLEFSNLVLERQRDNVQKASEAWFKLNAEIEKNNDAIKEIDRQTRLENLNLQRAILEEQLEGIIAVTETQLLAAREGSREQLALQQKLVRDKLDLELKTTALTLEQQKQLIEQANRDQLELRVAFNRRQTELDIKRTEEALKGVEAGSRRELELQQELVTQQAKLEVTSTTVSEAEKGQIREAAARERVRLELAFNAEQRRIAAESAQQVRADIIQLAIQRNQAQLVLAKEGTEERLQLEIAALELAATEERRVAGENAVQIAAINAKLQADILAVKRTFFEQAAETEQRIVDANNGVLRRSLERQVADTRNPFKSRAQAILELFNLEASRIDKQKQNLRDMYKANLISQQEYNARYAELEDERAKLSEDTNKGIEEDTKNTFAAAADFIFSTLSQFVGVIGQFGDIQSEKEKQRIDAQRNQISELREAGAITEKEEKARLKRLEQDEKKVQRDAAVRQKNIALFEASINTAAAITKAATAAPPPFNFILMGIAAALGAAQIAAIASRPIPSFFTGKKNDYEGLGRWGEAGTEILERDGQMYVSKKETVSWIKSDDIIYNPKETADILSGRSGGAIDGAGIFTGGDTINNNFEIDYDAMGKAVARNMPAFGLNIDEDGFTEYQNRKQTFTKYLNNRRMY